MATRIFLLFCLLNVLTQVKLQSQSSGCFNPLTNYGTAYDPLDIVSGDFNADGKADLVTVHGGTNQVAVLLGNGNGSFNPYVGYTTSYGGRSITSADFNGDGKLDVAMVNGGSIQVLMGNGVGGFAFPSYVFLAYAPIWLVSADFNNDGKPDLATVNSYQNYNLSVVLNLGNGTFGPEVTYPVINAYRMVAGDFNSDGKVDLATGNASGSFNGSFSLLLGNGNGTFGTAVTFNVGVGISGITAADFNNDGKLDLAMSQYIMGSLLVRLGSGTGNFATGNTYSVGTAPERLVARDFNGDNKLDLAVANYSSNNVSVINGFGNGVFGSPLNYSLGASPTGIVAADFNGDNKPDLAVPVNYYNVAILLNTASTISVSSSQASVCAGSTATLNVSGASSYTWSGVGPNTSSYVVTPAATSVYSVTGTNSVGCVSNTATLTVVVQPLPNLTFSGHNLVLCEGDSTSILVNGASSYSWSSGAQTSSITFIASGSTNYTVLGTNTLTGCSTNAVVQVSVSTCTGIKQNTDFTSSFQFFPNPVIDLLYLNIENASETLYTLSVLDALGRELWRHSTHSSSVTIDVHDFTGGLYFLRVNNEVRRFVIE